jgi:hypothetical protein
MARSVELKVYPAPIKGEWDRDYLPFSGDVTFEVENSIKFPLAEMIYGDANGKPLEPWPTLTVTVYSTWGSSSKVAGIVSEEVTTNLTTVTVRPRDIVQAYLEEQVKDVDPDNLSASSAAVRNLYNEIQSGVDVAKKYQGRMSMRHNGIFGHDYWTTQEGYYDPNWGETTYPLVTQEVGISNLVDSSNANVGVSGTYYFIEQSACEPPTEITLSQSSAAPGQMAWLSWSGAQPGESNDIVGYEIYRATSADGEYTSVAVVSSTETSGTIAVTAPATKGSAYYYKVVTLGALDGYNSIKSAVYATLLCDYSVCLAPASVTVDGASNVEPGAPVVIKWAEAAAGENNAIAGYEICYSDTVDGVPLGLILGQAKVNEGTFDSFGSSGDFFTAPKKNGTTYYFRVKTLGQLPGTDSDWSEAYAAVTCTYSSTNAPNRVTVDGAKSAYVAPGATVLLEWAGASNGANNKLTGYNVLRDGKSAISGISLSVTSAEVTAHDTTGHSYTYTVVAKGQYADSAPSAAATVYSYTEPKAPTTVEVSAPDSYVGGRVELSWSGAAPGGFNDIVGYKVYTSDTVNGAQTLVATISSTEAAASCYVDAPSTAGGMAYFRVVTVGSYSDSASSDYVTVTASGDAGADSDVTVIIKPEAPRPKRGMVLGDYDTANAGWTLTGWSFEEPEVQTSYVEIPWRADGPLDASTVLTGGDPRYGSRTLAAVFECSEGTRDDRERIISRMVNQLHGRRKNITLPDDRSRYIVGRVKVRKVYSDLAHASVEIEAICEPWRYSKTETRLELLVTENARTEAVCNNGRKVLVPELTVTGYKANVHISTGDLAWTLTAGTYRLPDLRLPTGATLLTYSGSGQVTIKYQEAIL